jgi:hypothetical protein
MIGGAGASRNDGTWIFRDPVETICDGADDDGNGQVDEGCDDDADASCDAGMILQGSPPICTSGGGDCDDADPARHPGAVDFPGNMLDEDCDGKMMCDPHMAEKNLGALVSCVARECHALVTSGRAGMDECRKAVRLATRGVRDAKARKTMR